MGQKLLFSILLICLLSGCIFPQTSDKESDTKCIRFIQPFKNQEFENGHFYVFLKSDSIKHFNNFTLYYSTNNGYSWDVLKKIEKNEIKTLYDSLKIEIKNDSIASELGKFKLEYTLVDNPNDTRYTESEIFKINSKGDNYAIISAIKSIYGTQLPSSEFLDFNFHVVIPKYIGIFMSADLSINTESDSNNIKHKISEAGLFLDFIGPFLDKKPRDRQITLGPLVKIFNTVPYYGFYLGNAELGGKLISSYINVCFMQRLLVPENKPDSLGLPSGFHNNLYFEFAVHSEHIDLLKYLRIKGGLLIPLFGWQSSNSKLKDIESRVVIEVPIGKVFRF
jgi:hypothetical protein